MNELVRVIAPTYDLSRGQIVSDNTHVGSRSSQLQAECVSRPRETISRDFDGNFTRFDPQTDLQPRVDYRALAREPARVHARARARACVPGK